MPNSWKRIEELFEAALPVAPEQRAQFLAQICPDNAELRRAVLSLLDSPNMANTLVEDSLVEPAEQRTTLLRGHKLGHFEIVELLGRGGMGDVYRARDLRLKRDVAIKVLPSNFARDPAYVARFEREARAASALSHPNLVHVYDVGQNDGIDWIASELVCGQTLRQLIKRGPLPARRAIEITVQIADGLAAAHASGIVHRDLNPGNVMLTPDGRAKILDFGLAKRGQALTGASESLGKGLTSPGLIVGTPGYMAPEQILGKQADARSDIFSLGVIVYELLSGKPAFSGDSAVEVFNANLKNEVAELPPSIPSPLKRIVHRCLDKEPSCRFQSAADVAFALLAVSDTGEGVPSATPKRAIGPKWMAVAVVAAILLAAGLYWAGTSEVDDSTSSAQHRLLRLSVLPPQGASFFADNFAISPDGQRLAFVASELDGKTRLWVRSLAASTAQQLVGTERALHPFWSADSRQVGFFAEGKLKTIDPGSGAIQIVCESPGAFGAAWNNQGTILFAPIDGGPIYKVRASGGTPEPVMKIAGQQALRWPSFLPDGDHFLYFVNNSGPGQSGEPDQADGIYVGSLSSMTSKRITAEGANNVQFAAGRIFFVRSRSLMAQRFDVKRMELRDQPEVIVSQEIEPEVAFLRSGFSVSDTGIVLFQSASENMSRLTWFDREGKEFDSVPRVGLTAPSLSQDGSLLVASSDDERNGKRLIRLYDFARGTSTRLSDGISDLFPTFSPDAKSIAYTHNNAIFVVPTDHSRKPERLTQSGIYIVNDWSGDGRHLVYMKFRGPHPPELNVFDFRDRSHRLYTEMGSEAQFSPDGKWVAFTGYSSDHSLDYYDGEVFVAPFPESGGRLQISNGGGAQAQWRSDGKELYYIDPDKKLMAVSIDTKGGK
ncbi:MAG: protein kinase, partial [Acidobacteriaceae bacterium]|nr:protein kinase [Acidobacteriaceae bacterium]